MRHRLSASGTARGAAEPPGPPRTGTRAGSEPSSSSSEPSGGRSRSPAKRLPARSKGLNPAPSSPPLCLQAQTSPF